MNDEQVRQSIKLQQGISDRLAQLAFADPEKAKFISRSLAEVATRGKGLAENLIPLLLQLPAENLAAISQVALAMKVEIDELTDALLDLRTELPEWTEFFRMLSNES
jgi:hypothetical protein